MHGQSKHQQHALAHAGYKSVAHYLVLTHQAGAALPEASSAAAAAPAENSAGAPTGNMVEAAAGKGPFVHPVTCQPGQPVLCRMHENVFGRQCDRGGCSMAGAQCCS